MNQQKDEPSGILYSTTPLSFWGGIDPITGIVIDHTHPLCGQCVSGKVLCIPSGRGSCTGSQVMLELILNGTAPRCIILRDIDVILCTGAIIAEEIFPEDKLHIPSIFSIGEENFQNLSGCTVISFDKNGNIGDDSGRVMMVAHDNVVGEKAVSYRFSAKNLLSSTKSSFEGGTLELLPEEKLMLDGRIGTPAQTIAMKTICRVAEITSAPNLIQITQAHIDGCTYIGPGGLRFVEKLVELEGKVAVPTTLNSISADRRRWEMLGMEKELAQPAIRVGDAYLELGCTHSFTCAPYLLPSSPSYGENIIWGESNAVVYANSVVGARTDKYADYFDIMAALVGKVPNFGVHLDSNRLPGIVLDVSDLVRNFVVPLIEEEVSNDNNDIDAFFPTMGWLCGNLSNGQVPLILGMESLKISMDDLKSFCAAFGTTGTAPLFHMAGVTPEAMEPSVVKRMVDGCNGCATTVTLDQLYAAHQALDSGENNTHFDNVQYGDNSTPGESIDLVAFGNPHLSLSELSRLAKLISDETRTSESVEPKRKHHDVKVMATLSRHVYEKGTELGFINELEKFGVQFINDTCWCMLIDPPVIPQHKDGTIMTNSGKYAHYGPGLTKRKFRFGSMSNCVEAARNGKWPLRGNHKLPSWLSKHGTRNFFSYIRRCR